MTDSKPDYTPDYRAEMGFTHRELLKGLPNAVAPYSVSKSADLEYRITHKNQTAVLTISPERSRKIAAIALPVIDVMIQFENFNELQYRTFLDRFKKYLHRGGG